MLAPVAQSCESGVVSLVSGLIALGVPTNVDLPERAPRVTRFDAVRRRRLIQARREILGTTRADEERRSNLLAALDNNPDDETLLMHWIDPRRYAAYDEPRVWPDEGSIEIDGLPFEIREEWIRHGRPDPVLFYDAPNVEEATRASIDLDSREEMVHRNFQSAMEMFVRNEVDRPAVEGVSEEHRQELRLKALDIVRSAYLELRSMHQVALLRDNYNLIHIRPRVPYDTYLEDFTAKLSTALDLIKDLPRRAF